ncbi:hypothetical protein BD779DRAFT_1466051 [Infundibulicybe gibba]|nr:hypothetical protein BD779DRAFT_1466051 [Infundibulicybe gibba]
MDNTYDVENSRNALEQLASQSKGIEDRGLANMAKNDKWMDQLRIECLEEPKTWRLLVATSSDGALPTVEEAVFTIQGVLMAKDLPPIQEKLSQAAARCRYLRQGVTITGLGSPTFELAMNVAVEISRMFDRQFPEGKMEPWGPSTTEMEQSCIELSNRYFTPKRDAPRMSHIPFSAAIDPEGILESIAKAGYIHGEENMVDYYTCSHENGGEKFRKAGPQVFRIGDLVEVQVSFTVVPLKAGKRKMLSVLRSIALLDGQFSQKRVMTKKISEGTKVTLKRRVGYNTAEGSSEKKGNMDVDQRVPDL